MEFTKGFAYESVQVMVEQVIERRDLLDHVRTSLFAREEVKAGQGKLVESRIHLTASHRLLGAHTTSMHLLCAYEKAGSKPASS